MVRFLKIFVVFLIVCTILPGHSQKEKPASRYWLSQNEPELQVGGARFDLYLADLKGKNVGLVVNQTSMVGKTHLVDTLVRLGVQVKRIFSPEHGFRGTADAGEKVKDAADASTGISIFSLYGARRKPSKEDLAGLDVLIFDIQDIGVRYYTFVSTLHNIMESCAENGMPLIIFDRPNPNGHYVDGSVLDPAYKSFVGMHPVPVVHGLTIGEYSQMINGEGWLADGVKCKLRIVPCQNYTHQTPYVLPVKPSPNMPNNRAIYLYPSICLFEGTVASVGRGTDKQFQVYGAPKATYGNFTFVPEPKVGAMDPFQKGKTCRGFDLTTLKPEDIRKDAKVNLSYIIDYYRKFPNKDSFFLANKFFDKLAGGSQLREQIIAGKKEKEIRKTWEPALIQFKEKRKKYLMYPD